MSVQSVLEISIPSPASRSRQEQAAPGFSLEESEEFPRWSGEDSASSASHGGRAEKILSERDLSFRSPAREEKGVRSESESGTIIPWYESVSAGILSVEEAGDTDSTPQQGFAPSQPESSLVPLVEVLNGIPEPEESPVLPEEEILSPFASALPFESGRRYAPGAAAAPGSNSASAPVAASPVAASPVAASPVVASPVAASPVVASPVAASPVVAAPVAASPVAASPVVAAPEVPVPGVPVPGEPVPGEPVSVVSIERSGPVELESGLRAEQASSEKVSSSVLAQGGKESSLPLFDLEASLRTAHRGESGTAVNDSIEAVPDSGAGIKESQPLSRKGFTGFTIPSGVAEKIASARKWLNSSSVSMQRSEPMLPAPAEVPAGVSGRAEQAPHPTSRGISLAGAADQVRARILEKFDGKAQHFEIHLDPPELGKVLVRLEIGPDKKLKAVLATREPAALAELMRGARGLELSLQESGMDIGRDGLTFRLDRGGSQSRSGQQDFSSSEDLRESEESEEIEEITDNVETLAPRNPAPYISGFRRTRLDISA